MPTPPLDILIEEDIVFGAYAPGTRLVEDRVMERYGVTRHATRAAFGALEGRKLVVHVPNKGVEVVRFTPDQIDALYDVRLVLETAAAERTPLPAPPEVTQTLSDLAQAHADAWTRGDYRQVFALNLRFHRVQFSCSTNPALIELIEEYTRMVQPIRAIKYDDPDHMQDIIRQHHQIVTALRGTDQDTYIAVVRAHLPASARAYREFFNRRFPTRHPEAAPDLPWSSDPAPLGGGKQDA